MTLALRFVDGHRIEVYVNVWLIHTHQVGNFIAEIGFAVSWHVSGTTAMLDPVRTVGHTPQSPRPLSLGVIGDSISYGAWSSLTWPDLLHGMARHLPGIGPLPNPTHENGRPSCRDRGGKY